MHDNGDSVNAKADFSRLLESWPSAFVARDSIQEFSGGILCAGTMANLDSKGKGPRGRVRIGRKVAYSVKELVEWLEDRSELLN